jgi:hypothetical protein
MNKIIIEIKAVNKIKIKFKISINNNKKKIKNIKKKTLIKMKIH